MAMILEDGWKMNLEFESTRIVSFVICNESLAHGVEAASNSNAWQRHHKPVALNLPHWLL
jgi:hypothetical protein